MSSVQFVNVRSFDISHESAIRSAIITVASSLSLSFLSNVMQVVIIIGNGIITVIIIIVMTIVIIPIIIITISIIIT